MFVNMFGKIFLQYSPLQINLFKNTNNIQFFAEIGNAGNCQPGKHITDTAG